LGIRNEESAASGSGRYKNAHIAQALDSRVQGAVAIAGNKEQDSSKFKVLEKQLQLEFSDAREHLLKQVPISYVCFCCYVRWPIYLPL